MIPARPIVSRAGPLADGRLPAVCVPLLAATGAELEAEAREARAGGADLVEWRIDYFSEPDRGSAVLDAARGIRANLGGLPLLATLRSAAEGGRPTALAPHQALTLLESIADSGLVEFIDVELSAGAGGIERVRAASRRSDTRLILSSHDFAGTPPVAEMLSRLQRAAALGADAAKLAVMPASTRDVLALLEATEAASRELSIPVITMAMGQRGLVTRVFGAGFGSALTFAAGRAASAPGQMPARALRTVLDTIADNLRC